MRKKTLAFFLILALVGLACFFLFYKNKSLRYIPQDADMVVLVDVKNVSRLYLKEYISHPSQWFREKSEQSNSIKLKDAGIKVPDYIQFFHLKNAELSEWYSVLELKDSQTFSNFLKQEKFESVGKYIFKKNTISIKLIGDKCLIKTGKTNIIDDFGKIASLFSESNSKENLRNASEFIENSHASISFISGSKISIFPIEIDDFEIRIAKENESENFDKHIESFLERNRFLEANLNGETIKKWSIFLNKSDFPSVSSLSLTSKIEEVRDTIIAYEYDDNFNEVEKISYQTLVQPNYSIQINSSHPESLISYFSEKKWMNAENQFTLFPFQLTLVKKEENKVIIQSKNNPIQEFSTEKSEFIFLKNNSKLLNSFSSLSSSEKEKFSSFQYLFFSIQNGNPYTKLKFNEENRPLILRF